MPRINYVKKARKDQGDCEHCRKPIVAGQGYCWVKKRYGPRRARHDGCPSWRPSQLSGSKMAEVMAAIEDYESGKPYDGPESWGEAVRSVGEAARSVGEQYKESAENMESGFGHSTSMSESLTSFGDELETWADELESAADEIAGVEVSENEEDDWQDEAENMADVITNEPTPEF